MGVAFQNPRAKAWFERHIVPPGAMLAGKGLI
jgi:hypothetical protein